MKVERWTRTSKLFTGGSGGLVILLACVPLIFEPDVVQKLTTLLILVLLAVPVLLMGPSRIYMGEHWPTDVLGAYCLGGLWVAGTLELLVALRPRVKPWWQSREFRRRWKPLL